MTITPIDDRKFDHAVFRTAVAKSRHSPGELTANDSAHGRIHSMRARACWSSSSRTADAR